MSNSPDGSNGKRRRVNLTIQKDVIDAARALDLNASRAAEAGIVEAIRAARSARWLDENRAAIGAHNARIEQEGVHLTPDWASGDHTA